MKSVESPLQVSALPYSDEELIKPEYKIDLPVSDKKVLCVSISSGIVLLELTATEQ